MESSSETVSNTITDNSQSVGKHSESDNQPVEVEGTAIVKNHNEKISQTRQMDKETDKNGTHTESEQNEVDLTKQKAVAEIETEEDEECESKNINETKTDETFDRPNGMQTKNPKEVSVKQPITITKELPCTATTITTPIADKNHVEEKEEFKLLMKEIVQNVQSSVEEDEQQQEEQEEETNGEKRIKKIEKVESSEEEEAADNEEEEGNDESQERKETDKTIVDVKQTFKKEQIQRYEKSKQLGRKEENVDALPSTATNTSCSNIQNKQLTYRLYLVALKLIGKVPPVHRRPLEYPHVRQRMPLTTSLEDGAKTAVIATKTIRSENALVFVDYLYQSASE